MLWKLVVLDGSVFFVSVSSCPSLVRPLWLLPLRLELVYLSQVAVC